MKKLLLAVLLSAVTACGAPTTYAPKTSPVPVLRETVLGGNISLMSDGEVSAVVLTGMITHDTDEAFMRAMATTPRPFAFSVTSSPGGKVATAHRIGYVIRANGMDTHVFEECFSACVDIFVAGTNRSADPGAIFGTHASTMPEFEYMRVRYYSVMGFPNFGRFTAGVPNWTSYDFTARAAYDVGFVTELLS